MDWAILTQGISNLCFCHKIDFHSIALKESGHDILIFKQISGNKVIPRKHLSQKKILNIEDSVF
jgi:hypothetical protein